MSKSVTAGGVRCRVSASIEEGNERTLIGSVNTSYLSPIHRCFPEVPEKKGAEQSEGWRRRSEWRGVVIPGI